VSEQPKKLSCGIGLLAHVGASRGAPHKSPLNALQFAIKAAIKRLPAVWKLTATVEDAKETCTPSPEPAVCAASRALR
jgi:hypothetical protein